jgi:hypothetical protein
VQVTNPRLGQLRGMLYGSLVVVIIWILGVALTLALLR